MFKKRRWTLKEKERVRDNDTVRASDCIGITCFGNALWA